jgi:hypothetical protein
MVLSASGKWQHEELLPAMFHGMRSTIEDACRRLKDANGNINLQTFREHMQTMHEVRIASARMMSLMVMTATGLQAKAVCMSLADVPDHLERFAGQI